MKIKILPVDKFLSQSALLTKEESKERARKTMKELYSKIQDVRKQFHDEKSKDKRDGIRIVLNNLKKKYNLFYAALHGIPHYSVASDNGEQNGSKR